MRAESCFAVWLVGEPLLFQD